MLIRDLLLSFVILILLSPFIAAQTSTLQLELLHYKNGTTNVESVRLLTNSSDSFQSTTGDITLTVKNASETYQTAGKNISFVQWISPLGRYIQRNTTHTYHNVQVTGLELVEIKRNDTVVGTVTKQDIIEISCDQSKASCEKACTDLAVDCSCENPPCQQNKSQNTLGDSTGQKQKPAPAETANKDDSGSTNLIYYAPAVLFILLVTVAYRSRNETS